MCGIAGFQGRFPTDLHERMGCSIAHRGPDDEGTVLFSGAGPSGTTGFAFRRLAIIDLSSHGHQPMAARCAHCAAPDADDLVLIYNGEIYNHVELRRELEAKGHTFRSRTDTEVILHLYATEGLRAMERLNGIFAFAIYDGRERGRPDGVRQGDVLLARDQVGVKPLYHASLPEGVLFASEIKAMLQHETLPRTLDPVAIHETLAYLWTPAPRTAFAAVRKLRPGHALLVRDGRIVREWSYYDLPYGREPLRGSDATIAEDLRRELEAAVRRQMMSDVPVGAFLSGGLDSSAVVAMMRRARPDHRPVCYSIGFDDDGTEGTPDLPYARRVAAHLDVELREIRVEADMIRHLERTLYLLDEPQADPAPINALLIAEQARRDGITVLLSGAGGDDLFSGYRRHQALVAERLWRWLPAPVRTAVATTARRVHAGRSLLGTDRVGVRRVAKAFAYADRSDDARLVSYFHWSDDAVRQSLYTPEFLATVGSSDVSAPLLESLARIPAERNALNRMLYLEAKHFLTDHNLNYTDKTGMAAGVEVRVPLLDLELIDFATRIPAAMKQRGAVGKAIFKKAMEPILPHDVIYRKKTGFGAPLRRWLRHELRDVVAETLSPASLRDRGLFDPDAVSRLVAANRAGTVDGAYTIFALVCIELWCRRFVDSASPVSSLV